MLYEIETTDSAVEPKDQLFDANVLRELQARRVNLLKAELRLNNQRAALVRRQLGYQWEMPEKEATALKKRAVAILKALDKDGEIAPEIDGMEATLIAYKIACDPITKDRARLEKVMELIARDVPSQARQFVQSVRGFGDFGHAMIIGEACDLRNYPNPAKLWKRMGLAVMDGQRQGNPGKNATAEDWIEHGYSGRRRSVVWNVGDSLLRAQLRNVKDEAGERTDQSSALGFYGQLYLDRKAYEMPRVENKKGHAHNRAKRYVEKRLLADLWETWNE